MSEVVNCAAYLDGRGVANVDVSSIHEVLQHSEKFVWLGLHEPGEETLQHIQRFSIFNGNLIYTTLP
jgi:magnesium transporter